MTAAARRRSGLAALLRAAAVVPLIAAGGVAPAPADLSPDGEIVFPSAVGEVEFPHSLHADELGFECSECHHETAAARLSTPHDAYFEDLWSECRKCHGEGTAPASPQSCDACHHASPTSTADETLSAKVVIHRSCWVCHDSGTGEEASRSCSFCHAARRSIQEVSR
jgi:hypothetical protein